MSITRDGGDRIGLFLRREMDEEGPQWINLSPDYRWTPGLRITHGRGHVGNFIIYDACPVDPQAPDISTAIYGVPLTPNRDAANHHLSNLRLAFWSSSLPSAPLSSGPASPFLVNVVPETPELPAGWYASPHPAVRTVVAMTDFLEADRRSTFASDLHFEASVAHSPPIRPIVEHMVASFGWERYLEEKLQFVRGYATNSVYGFAESYNERPPYVSLAHAMRVDWRRPPPPEEIVAAWDQFMLHLIDSVIAWPLDNASLQLSARHGVGGQLGRMDDFLTQAERLAPGVAYLVRVCARPSAFEERRLRGLGFSARPAVGIGSTVILQDKQDIEQLITFAQQCSNPTLIAALKFYVPRLRQGRLHERA